MRLHMKETSLKEEEGRLKQEGARLHEESVRLKGKEANLEEERQRAVNEMPANRRSIKIGM